MNAVDPGLAALSSTIDQMLTPNELDPTLLAHGLADLGAGSDFADVFLETTEQESWSLQDQRVKFGSYYRDQGMGIRAVSGDQVAFAHSAAISPAALETAAASVRSMRRLGETASQNVTPLGGGSRSRSLYNAENPVEAADAAAKIHILQEVDRRARALDPRIVSVNASLNLTVNNVLIAMKDERLAADIRPMTGLSVQVLAEQNGRRASGQASGGSRNGLQAIDDAEIGRLVGDAVRIALVNLEARPSPAGVMSVVLGPGFPGMLLHEAVGHGLEGDHHRKRSSVFVDHMGAQIAAPGVTVIDDGSIAGMAGSLNIDDEGEETQATTLIENGKLTGLLQDRMNARLMNQRSTGNGRRQTYAHLPMPRMTNTYLAAGEHDPEEIVKSVKNGIYAISFGGGRVDITSGQFNFSATEAYLIEDGKITTPIEGATLIGLGHEALKQIKMVGNDLKLANGSCGKAGQSVPVTVGQPTVRIDDMVVGGTQ